MSRDKYQEIRSKLSFTQETSNTKISNIRPAYVDLLHYGQLILETFT